MPAYFGDPDRAFDEYDADQEERLSGLPRCSCCGEAIQDETFFEVRGEIYCKNCMEGFERYVMDYMEGIA